MNTLVTAQRITRMRKKLKNIMPEILKIYFHPEMKGGFLYKQEMKRWLDNNIVYE